jgi:RNA polymerase sigma-70 factor (ECF subfamily)
MAFAALRDVISKTKPGETGGVAGAEPTDEDLIGRVRLADDADAFESLMHRYEHEIFGFLRRYLGNVEMAEDVCQATFLRVHLKRQSFEDGRRFRPWLYAIATNQAIDACRRARRHRMVGLDNGLRGADDVRLIDFVPDHQVSADDGAEREESRQWVASAVEELPEQMKTPLDLVYRRGMKYREAADTLGIPVGTVKSRLHAALTRLSRSWQESGLNN